MKISNTLLHILLPAAAVVALASCDIDSDERFIPMPAVESARVVLLEEFTGQKCVNCPNAHGVINSLLDQYGDNLIAVSIHAGGKANTYGEGEYSTIVGLRNDEGEQYASWWGVNSFPQGVVNRVTGLQTMDLWAGSIRSQLQRPARLEFDEFTATLSPDGKHIDIHTSILPHDNLNGFLQLWVVESGIVARQKLPDGSTDNEYVHNHVFRASVNGLNGDPITLVTREPLTRDNRIALRDHWTAENLSIVAFVYNDGGVEQAGETHVRVSAPDTPADQ